MWSPTPCWTGPASWLAPRRYTQTLFNKIVATGEAPAVTPGMRGVMLEDLRYWRAGAVVLVPHTPGATALRFTLGQLFQRPPLLVGGVELWRVPPAG